MVRSVRDLKDDSSGFHANIMDYYLNLKITLRPGGTPLKRGDDSEHPTPFAGLHKTLSALRGIVTVKRGHRQRGSDTPGFNTNLFSGAQDLPEGGGGGWNRLRSLQRKSRERWAHLSQLAPLSQFAPDPVLPLCLICLGASGAFHCLFFLWPHRHRSIHSLAFFFSFKPLPAFYSEGPNIHICSSGLSNTTIFPAFPNFCERRATCQSSSSIAATWPHFTTIYILF